MNENETIDGVETNETPVQTETEVENIDPVEQASAEAAEVAMENGGTTEQIEQAAADAATEAIEATANNTEKPKKKSKTKKESKMVAVKNPPKKPAAPKANPKPVKVPAPKKPATGKPTAPPKKVEANGKADTGGLRKPQLRILAALSKSGRPMTRVEIAKAAPVDQAACVEYVGSADPEKRKANDAKHFPSLVTLGYVKQFVDDRDGEQVVVHAITASGKKVLDKSGS